MEDYTGHYIKTAKLNGRKLTATFGETRPEGIADVTKKSDVPVHRDLTDTFNKLVPHFILLTEMQESVKIELEIENKGSIENVDIETYINILVTGYKHDEEDSIQGIRIFGKRCLQSGRELDIISSFQAVESSGVEGEYPFIEDLALVIQACDYEVEQYLFNSKFAVTQKTIDFDAATAETPFLEDTITPDSPEDQSVDNIITITLPESKKKERKPKSKKLKELNPAC